MPDKTSQDNNKEDKNKTSADSASENNTEVSEDTKRKNEEIQLHSVFKAIYTSFSPDAPSGSDKLRDDTIRSFLKQKISSHPISKKYNILILHDEGRMVKSDADHIYRATTKFDEKRPLMLILYATGGAIESGYLIGKLCKEFANDKFLVIVPRQAKSAATLICCAADEIHMGSLSELGPIDPQIGKMPALGLKNAVEHIADLIRDYPHSSDMFAKYLHLSLNPIHLGYFERVAESAAQYAERLLRTHADTLTNDPSSISHELVYSYKDHGFVIDRSEAMEIFGKNVVKTDTKEYRLGNTVYGTLMHVSRLADYMGHYFYLIGSCDSELNFRKKQTE